MLPSVMTGLASDVGGPAVARARGRKRTVRAQPGTVDGAARCSAKAFRPDGTPARRAGSGAPAEGSDVVPGLPQPGDRGDAESSGHAGDQRGRHGGVVPSSPSSTGQTSDP